MTPIEKLMSSAQRVLQYEAYAIDGMREGLEEPEFIGDCMRHFRELTDALTEASRSHERIVSFIKDVESNWDCDSDGHRYNTGCRCCEAARLLKDLGIEVKK